MYIDLYVCKDLQININISVLSYLISLQRNSTCASFFQDSCVHQKGILALFPKF